jgi:hypothetical protein
MYWIKKSPHKIATPAFCNGKHLDQSVCLSGIISLGCMSLGWFYLRGFMAFPCHGAVGYGSRDTEKSVAAPGAGTGGAPSFIEPGIDHDAEGCCRLRS